MHVSTDLPYGPKAIRLHMDSVDAGAPRLSANVRLDGTVSGGVAPSAFPRTCSGCGRKFITQNENKSFHSDPCHAKATERYQAKGICPAGWKQCVVCTGPFLPERSNEKYCTRKSCARASARSSAAATVSERAQKAA
jgi:hypothetical protein